MHASWTIGAPVYDMVLIDDTVFLATGDDVRVLDHNASVTDKIPLPARHLAAIRNGEDTLLAVGSIDGSVTALFVNRQGNRR